jgi:hypothetical protein
MTKYFLGRLLICIVLCFSHSLYSMTPERLAKIKEGARRMDEMRRQLGLLPVQPSQIPQPVIQPAPTPSLPEPPQTITEQSIHIPPQTPHIEKKQKTKEPEQKKQSGDIAKVTDLCKQIDNLTDELAKKTYSLILTTLPETVELFAKAAQKAAGDDKNLIEKITRAQERFNTAYEKLPSHQLKPQNQPKEEQSLAINIKNIAITPLSTNKIGEKEVVQLHVKSQFDSDITSEIGALTCPYQALKNGFLVVLALYGKLGLMSDQSTLQAALDDTPLIMKFFGPDGPWRTIAVNEQAYRTFSRSLSKECNAAMRNDVQVDGFNQVELYQFYLSVVTTLASIMAHEVIDKNVSNTPIIQRIQERVKWLWGQSTIEKQKQLSLDENKTLADVLSALLTEKLITTFIDIDKIPQPPSKYDGDRFFELDADFMQLIIKYEKEHGILKDIPNTTYLIYNDLSEFNSDIDINKEEFDRAAQQAAANPNSIVMACINTARHNPTKLEPTSGHWFTLIWTQNRCYVMDSAGNALRTHDANVATFVNTFEEQVREKTIAKKESPL